MSYFKIILSIFLDYLFAAILLNILMNNFFRFALFLLYLISLIEIVQDIKIN